MAFRLRPLHEDKLHFADLSNTQILILALEASQKLEWNIEGIALREVIFYVPMGMRSQGEEVTFTIEEGNSGEISVRSQCASVQLVDYGKNRKNIQKLQETMEEIKSALTPEELAQKANELEEELTRPLTEEERRLQAESENLDKGGMSFHTLPAYSTYSRKSHWIDIYNQGTGELSWSITPSEDWILISQKSGKTSAENRIHISVDWDKVPVGEKVKGQIDVTSGSQKESVLVSVFNPESPARTEVQGLYVEENGYISIPAADFHRKFESNDIRMSILPGLGFEGRSLQLGNPTAPLQMYRAGDVPRVEYDFYTFNAGIYDVYTYVLPTFPLHAERDYKLPEHTNSDTKYSVRIDDGSISTPSTSAIEYSQIWYDSVLKNCRVNKSTLYVKKPGKHTLQIRCGDPGVVIQKIVIDLGGMKRSYLGPQSTICN